MDVFNPKVSIIIPVYNGANYLREAINSALEQTYQNIEIIVVNDGSNDNGMTETIALSYSNDKVRYFSKPNGGVASALNLGIQKMTGEYFSWLSHDDAYYPTKIERQIRFLSVLSDKTTVLFTDFTLYFEETKRKQHIKIPERNSNPVVNILLLLFASSINGCTLLINKSVIDRIGYFNTKLRTTQDYDYWFRMVDTGITFTHVKECLVGSRQHSEQDTLKIGEIHAIELNDLYDSAVTLMNKKYFELMSVKELNVFLKIVKTRCFLSSYEKIKVIRDCKIEALPLPLRAYYAFQHYMRFVIFMRRPSH